MLQIITSWALSKVSYKGNCFLDVTLVKNIYMRWIVNIHGIYKIDLDMVYNVVLIGQWFVNSECVTLHLSFVKRNRPKMFSRACRRPGNKSNLLEDPYNKKRFFGCFQKSITINFFSFSQFAFDGYFLRKFLRNAQ